MHFPSINKSIVSTNLRYVLEAFKSHLAKAELEMMECFSCFVFFPGNVHKVLDAVYCGSLGSDKLLLLRERTLEQIAERLPRSSKPREEMIICK